MTVHIDFVGLDLGILHTRRHQICLQYVDTSLDHNNKSKLNFSVCSIENCERKTRFWFHYNLTPVVIVKFLDWRSMQMISISISSTEEEGQTLSPIAQKMYDRLSVVGESHTLLTSIKVWIRCWWLIACRGTGLYGVHGSRTSWIPTLRCFRLWCRKGLISFTNPSSIWMMQSPRILELCRRQYHL